LYLIDRYTNRFHKFDKDSKGFITTVDVQRVLQNISVQIDENALHEILNEVDLNKNGQVELNEFLQVGGLCVCVCVCIFTYGLSSPVLPPLIRGLINSQAHGQYLPPLPSLLSFSLSLSLSLSLYHEKLNKQTRLENMIIDSSGRRINYPSDTDTHRHTH
uniref:EF-hand domain-containing protein n=1 Tax=Hucho hucho TaxID=62062 RepID=A0A4W5JXK3_9TELE